MLFQINYNKILANILNANIVEFNITQNYYNLSPPIASNNLYTIGSSGAGGSIGEHRARVIFETHLVFDHNTIQNMFRAIFTEIRFSCTTIQNPPRTFGSYLSRYVAEFEIYDINLFESQLKNHEYKLFNEIFNKQLDDIIEEV